MSKQIIQDVWYQYIDNDVIPYIIIYIEQDNKEYSIAHVAMPYTTADTLDQEDTYNFCLSIAHDLGYYLEGEIDNEI